MDIGQLLSVLWRRKLTAAAVLVVVLGTAIAGLQVVSPVYESTSTLALSPRAIGNDLLFLQTVDAIVPIYATAADSGTTKDAARTQLGGKLASISVRSFQSSPIIKIDARGRDPRTVQRSAQAVTDALQARVANGEVGVPGLQLDEIDHPGLPDKPVFPDKKLTVVVALVLGFLLALAAALLRDNVSSRISTRYELAEAAGVPVFAEVPLERALARHAGTELLSNGDSDMRTVAEALRDLRTNLSFADDTARTIVVTSPGGSHGKSTVSIGLAATFARSGANTVLVDADLRKGRLAQTLGMDGAPGLHELLIGAPLDAALRRTRLDGLTLLPGGLFSTDSAELLATHFPAVLTQLEQRFDVVVIDTTPLLPVYDARAIARLAEATIVVVSAGTTRADVEDAIQRLALISLTPTAAVLNKSRGKQAQAYYGRETVKK
jgi:receptor protein-tyrosine kinase